MGSYDNEEYFSDFLNSYNITDLYLVWTSNNLKLGNAYNTLRYIMIINDDFIEYKRLKKL